MARIQSKKALIVSAIVLGVALLFVAAIVLTKKTTPAATNAADTSKDVTAVKNTPTETDVTDTTPTSPKLDSKKADPSTLLSVDVQPLAISVFYSKGIPGFEFTVLKTADQTQYAEFTSASLVGTKCTDDQGAFASIIKNPSDSEAQTISQTVKVGSDTYGLSLAGANCTSNLDLLTQYQAGFKNGFTSLTAL